MTREGGKNDAMERARDRAHGGSKEVSRGGESKGTCAGKKLVKPKQAPNHREKEGGREAGRQTDTRVFFAAVAVLKQPESQKI